MLERPESVNQGLENLFSRRPPWVEQSTILDRSPELEEDGQGRPGGIIDVVRPWQTRATDRDSRG